MTSASSRYAKIYETATVARLLTEMAPARDPSHYAYRDVVRSECACIWDRVMLPLRTQAWEKYVRDRFPEALEDFDGMLRFEPNAWAVCAAISRKVLTMRDADREKRALRPPFDDKSALSDEMLLCCGLEACRNALPDVGQAYFDAVDWRKVNLGGALSEIMRWVAAPEQRAFLERLWRDLAANPLRESDTAFLPQIARGRFALRLGLDAAGQCFLDAAQHCDFSLPNECTSLLSGLVRTGSLPQAQALYRQFVQVNAPAYDRDAHFAVLAANMGILVKDFDRATRFLASACVQSSSDFGIRLQVCSLYIRLSLPDAALAGLLEILPTVEVDHRVAGLAYSLGRQLGRYDWAVALLRQAEASAALDYRLMQLHFAFGHIDASKSILDHFLRDGIDFGGVLYFDRAEMAVFEGRWAEAVTLYTKFLSFFYYPEVFTEWIWMAHFHLALLLLHVGDLTAAREILEVSLRQYCLPENACAAVRDVMDFRGGRASPTFPAIAAWEACADVLSDDYALPRPWLYLKAAQWYARLGDMGQAWRVLRHKLFPSRSFLPEALSAARQALGEGDAPQFARAAAALGAAFSPFAAPQSGWRAIMERDVLADCPPEGDAGVGQA